MLDPARLPRVIIDPMSALSFKRERDTDFRDTVVTLLLELGEGVEQLFVGLLVLLLVAGSGEVSITNDKGGVPIRTVQFNPVPHCIFTHLD